MLCFHFNLVRLAFASLHPYLNFPFGGEHTFPTATQALGGWRISCGSVVVAFQEKPLNVASRLRNEIFSWPESSE